MEISARPIPKTDAKNSGDEAKEVNYIYANELSFLKQYLQERPSSSSSILSIGGRPAASREEVDLIASECIPQVEEDDLIDIGGSEAVIRPLSNDSASSRTPKRRRRVSVDPVDESILKALEKNQLKIVRCFIAVLWQNLCVV
uniref:Uncharacterized protein n=1 Tax=Meloidogyne incognita TaxID=6306 RepID=A0A914MRE9_MELIC